MRTVFLVCLLGLITMSSRADMGVTYCMKVSLKLKNQSTHTGYIIFGSYDLRMEKDEAGWLYRENEKTYRLKSKTNDPVRIFKSDVHFHHFARQQLMKEKTLLYRSVVLLHSDEIFPNTSDRIPVAIEPGLEFTTLDIVSFFVHEVYFTMPGMLSDSNCTAEDLSWVSKKVSGSEDLGSATLCDYTAVFFEERSDKANQLIAELKALYARTAKLDGENFTQEDYESLLLLTKNKIAALRELHVLILSSCSC